jgi:hypothetical protein
MASSVYDTYGKIAVKNVWMDESGLRLFNADDDTKYVELKAVAGPSGQHSHTLPHSSGVVLNDQSTLAAAKVGINAATAVDALNSLDEFLLYDTSATANKKVSAADLKTFCASGSGLPSGTNAEIIVFSGTTADAVPMSGHVAIDAAGATTIQNSVLTNAMVANGAAIAYSKLSLGNSIQNADLVDGAVGTIKLGNDAVSSAKLADQSEVVIDNGGHLDFYANGGGAHKFKFVCSGGNTLLLQYSSDSGATWSTVQSFAAA